MNFIDQIKNNIRGRIKKYLDYEIEAKVSYLVPQLVEFHTASEEKLQSKRDHTKDPYNNHKLYAGLRDKLIDIGLVVNDIDIDVSDFKKWLDEFHEIHGHYRRINDVHIEKCLQHYLSYRYLELTKDDVYIDFAAAGSPWAQVLNKRGFKSYRLDLVYEKGIKGIDIGADATKTNLPDNFASAISLQCSFEHFMGDADVKFLGEASRILNNKGRFIIVPIYIDETYFVATSPYFNQKNIVIDNGADRIWRDDEFIVPFSRTYSPEVFKQRIFSKIPSGMTGKVFYINNLIDVMKSFPDQRIYSFFMFYCEKEEKGMDERD